MIGRGKDDERLLAQITALEGTHAACRRRKFLLEKTEVLLERLVKIGSLEPKLGVEISQLRSAILEELIYG